MSRPYLLFNLNTHTVAINAACVGEVLALPELMLIPDAPAGIVGVFNLRGQIIPVVDLSLQAIGPRTYEVTDRLLLLRPSDSEDLTVGVIVKAVQGIQNIAPEAIQPCTGPEIPFEAAQHLLAGVTEESSIFILKDPQVWLEVAKLQRVTSITSFLLDQSPEDFGEASFSAAFLPEAQTVLRQRAEDLRRSPQDEVAAGTALTVVAVGGQLLGIDTQHVREFVTVQQATPLPCCPPHIVGSMGLRGEIVTILDACLPLGLPTKALVPRAKAIVLEAGTAPVAMLVDEVQDAMFSTDPELFTPLTSGDGIKSVYITGVVPYEQRQLHVLDLPALLNSADVVVDERL